ncbi:putative integrase [Streptomyces scabiei 87.22]|uniref:Putative integrase n=1 Tax=Streptomyces scabiei (strain 87.22) TaxID=680198 RepID=C9Z141_STRSW|nr:site-specific integrase [Streptomyces scabiei]MDX2577723.1 site-specific integrase [Streptomyces scabiei]MDX2656116.1 site-specific integrase [Streptomyces scabiei]MDX2723050.1 site-specific integrase [Streptomyces scabiei]MDX2868728.1 site-specific integrase [Streptomyces scabiei]MDX2886676.1 site-specific integrase [Streptomyces scabiei]
MAEEKKRTRQPNGRSSIYLGNDGKWHGRVTVGTRDDGKPDRRHVERKTRAEVTAAVRELEKQRDAKTVRKPGRPWTVTAWLTHWIENVAPLAVNDNTMVGYGVAVRKHLIPGLGAHRLDKLSPEHIEVFYAKMQANGSKAATAHQVHRTFRVALNEAVRRGHLGKNPVQLAKAPKVGDYEVEPYTVAEVQRLLRAAGQSRNSARWAVALALGLRQGEVLGLQWEDVDLDAGFLMVRRSRHRPQYAHGCAEPCGRKAGYCPQKRRSNPETSTTKSRAGRRAVGLPEQLVDLLRAHRTAQDTEREAAGTKWVDGGLVFPDENGRSPSHRTDWAEWKALLAGAKIRDGRLHDARHTAATVLLILGVPERAVMGLMGWSTTAMAARYQHMVDAVRADVARQVDGLIWRTDGENTES